LRHALDGTPDDHPHPIQLRDKSTDLGGIAFLGRHDVYVGVFEGRRAAGFVHKARR
jgi:hypothetical protein